jgi:hypothetical protein
VARSGDILSAIVEFFGQDPKALHIGEPSLAAESVAARLDELGVPYTRAVGYPTKV